MAATRLPGKVLLPLAGEPAIIRMVERVRRSRTLHDVWIASTEAPADRAIAMTAERIGCPVHRGPIEDITLRLLQTAEKAKADVLVQLTGDCPLIDGALVDICVEHMMAANAEYCVLGFGSDLPIGLDVRAVSVDALRRSAEASSDPIDRVHGTYFIHQHPELYRHAHAAVPEFLRRPEFRLTVDEPEDYELVRRIFDTLFPSKPDFGAADIVALLDKNPDWADINRSVRQKKAEEG